MKAKQIIEDEEISAKDFTDPIPEMPYIFYHSYCACALWASTGDDGEPLTDEELAEETEDKMKQDCQKFWNENYRDIEHDPNQAGYDFWLTRNHHGSGFGDSDAWSVAGAERLTAASHSFGECNLYAGDDGKIYAM